MSEYQTAGIDLTAPALESRRRASYHPADMRTETLLLVGAAAVMSGCVLGGGVDETRGATRALYNGAVLVKLTNATPDRLCGFYMTYDRETEYGDNWLPESGVPSGSSVDFKVKPGKYKARWDTCRDGPKKPYYAATLWRDTAVDVQQQTQLYAFVADTVSPTKRAQVLGHGYRVVHFAGQAIDPTQQREPSPLDRLVGSQTAARASEELRPIGGFIGFVVLSVEIVAQLRAETPPPAPAPAPAAKPAPAPPPAPAPAAKPAPAPPPAPPPAAAPAPAPRPVAPPAAAPAPAPKPVAPPAAAPAPAPAPKPVAPPAAAPAPAPAPKPATPPAAAPPPAPRPAPPPAPSAPAAPPAGTPK
jgi:hypothetical protein